jgi:hypothetical protein
MDREDGPTILCHACGEPVRGSVCEACGTPVTPSVGGFLSGLATLGIRGLSGVLLAFVLAPVSIVYYLLSPEGQADAPLVVALLAGPFVIAGLAWYGYRRWYRRHYPDER